MPPLHEEFVLRFEGGERSVEVLSHLVDCHQCRHEVEERSAESPELQAVPAELVARAKHPGRGPRRFDFRRAGWVAAAAIAATALAVLLVPRAEEPRVALRSMGSSGARVEVLTPAADATVAASAFDLQWSPVTGARRYTVRVLDERGGILAERTTERTTVTIEDLPVTEPAFCYWYVIAAAEDGRILESRPRPLRVVPGK